MAPAPAAAAICDRGDCPAPAQRTVMLHGQDFHFCGHHTTELARALEVPGTVSASRANVDAGGVTPRAALAAGRLPELAQRT